MQRLRLIGTLMMAVAYSLLLYGTPTLAAHPAGSDVTVVALDYVGPSEKEISSVIIGASPETVQQYLDRYVNADGWFHFYSVSELPMPMLTALSSTVAGEPDLIDGEAAPRRVLEVTLVRGDRPQRLFFDSRHALRLLDRMGKVCRDPRRQSCADIGQFRKTVRRYLRLMG